LAIAEVKIALALGALLMPVSCHQATSAEGAGRFQMVASNNDRREVHVLDTQNDDIWACGSGSNLRLSLACGEPIRRTR
jgi:hypothetical protein